MCSKWKLFANEFILAKDYKAALSQKEMQNTIRDIALDLTSLYFDSVPVRYSPRHAKTNFNDFKRN